MTAPGAPSWAPAAAARGAPGYARVTVAVAQGTGMWPGPVIYHQNKNVGLLSMYLIGNENVCKQVE